MNWPPGTQQLERDLVSHFYLHTPFSFSASEPKPLTSTQSFSEYPMYQLKGWWSWVCNFSSETQQALTPPRPSCHQLWCPGSPFLWTCMAISPRVHGTSSGSVPQSEAGPHRGLASSVAHATPHPGLRVTFSPLTSLSLCNLPSASKHLYLCSFLWIQSFFMQHYYNITTGAYRRNLVNLHRSIACNRQAIWFPHLGSARCWLWRADRYNAALFHCANCLIQ